jgi:hypothetical protein
MNRSKWILSLVFALATVRAEAQIRRVQPGNPGADIIRRAFPEPGIPGGLPPGVGVLGGPGFGPQPPIPGLPNTGPLGGGHGIGGGFQGGWPPGPGQQPPIFGPQLPIPGNGPGGKDKDDDSKRDSFHVPPIYGRFPSLQPETSSNDVPTSFRGLSETHTSIRARSGLNGFGRGIGKWFGAGLAGAIAAIGWIFRTIFRSRQVDKTNTRPKQFNSVPLGSNGKGGVWIR